MKLLKVLPLLLCTLALVPQFAPAQTSNSANRFRKNEGAISDHYIVVFKESVPPARVEAFAKQLAQAHGGKLGFTYKSALRGFSVEMSEAQAVALSRSPHVEYVEEDTLVEGAGVQSNPTWALDRLDQRDLPLNAAYNYATSGAGVNAYIIDSGIRKTHQEFGDRVVLAYDNVSTDDLNGLDCFGHGTLVAGIIGSNTYGVAKDVKLHSVRVLNCSNVGSTANIIAGMDWVVANSVKPAVANLSFMVANIASSSIDLAVRNLVASGVTTIVAAGNNNVDAGARSPARVTEAITVAASDMNDNRATFSNFGAVVDVFAPGVDIPSTSNVDDTSTGIRSGTSYAAPFVAGLAARYLAAHPGTQPDTVSQAITNSATPGKVINPGAGSPNLLAYTVSFTVNDNFNDNTRDATKWLAPTSTDVVVAEQNGRLEITPAANATSYDGYKSATNIDLTDARVSVQASIGQTVYGFGSYLMLNHSSSDYLVMGIAHHDLLLHYVVGGVPSSTSIPYDATQHAYRRIRHNRADDTINWEASPDGATWTVLYSAPRPFPITNLQISLTAGKSDAATPTTTASFDNLMYEATTPPPPANTSGTVATTISDDFNDNTRHATRWLAPASTDVVVAEQNGRLEITPAANATSYDGYKSAINIDLTDARVSVQASIGQTVYGFGSYLMLNHSGSDYLVMGIAHHDLLLHQVVGGIASNTSIPYDAAQHAYRRIRHNRADDTINWEASPDGATWTVLRSAPRPFPVTSLQVSLIAGKSDAATPTTTVTFDNLLHEPNPVPPANNAPQVNAGLDATVNEGSTFSGTASFTDVDNADTWTVTVDYGDGSGAQPVTPTGAKTIPLNHVYRDNAANPYTVTVTVRDAAGATSSDTALVTSVNAPPTPAITGAQSPIREGAGLTLGSAVSDAGEADTAAGFTYLWTVTKSGVADAPQEKSRQSAFDFRESAGTYVVTLRVTDKDGGTGAANATITVNKIEQNDNFDDNSTDTLRWHVKGAPGLTVAEQNGQLQVTTPGSTTVGYDGYHGRNSFDLTTRTASVEAVKPAYYHGLDTYFVLEDATNTGNLLVLLVGGAPGSLLMEDRVNGTVTSRTQIPYDATQHRFWRFRHNPATDTLNWETSPDAIQWTVRHTAPRRFTLTSMRAQLYAGRYTTTTPPMTAIFDNYRVEDVPPPPLSFGDDFNDNLRDATKWLAPTAADVVVAEQNGRLEIIPTTAAANYDGYKSATNIDLTDARVSVQTSIGQPIHGFGSYLVLSHSASDYLVIGIGSQTLVVQQIVSGVLMSTALPYDAAQHRHWRIRHNRTNDYIYWEVSADGVTWRMLRAEPRPFPINNLQITLKAGKWDPATPTTIVTFDNLLYAANPPIPASTGGTLSDNFDDNLRDATKWLEPTAADVVVAEQNGRLEIIPTAAAANYDGYKSATNIDLTDARVSVQASIGQPIHGFGSYLVLSHSASDYLVIGIGSQTLVVQQIVSGVLMSTALPYDAAQHRHWRIRHNRTNDYIYWEVSADGVTWRMLRAEPRPFPINNLQITLKAGKWDAATPTTIVAFDNLRIERNEEVR